MKLCIKLFDFANRKRLLLGVCGSIAQLCRVEPIIIRLVMVLSLLYLGIVDNFIGTAVVLYITSYLAGLFALWIDDDSQDTTGNNLLLAKYILKH